jgi:2-amino-4-hydroxy-6-hydroxymethyldihydropteridine diphosphokinase
MTAAFIGLGSNLGERFQQLQSATDAIIRLPKTMVKRASPVYETPPIGENAQFAFLNAVLEVQTELAPIDLLDYLKIIEHEHGRPQDYDRWTPRLIDLDILLYGNLTLKTNRLTLPHPEMPHRRFVLIPLNDIGDGLSQDQQSLLSEWLAQTTDTSSIQKYPYPLRIHDLPSTSTRNGKLIESR